MNQSDVNYNKRKLDRSYRLDENKIKISNANKFEHEIVKCTVCYVLKQRGYNFVTEGIFLNKQRCDVMDLVNDVCYEVVCSEKEESIINKKNTYPTREIIVIDTKDYKDLTLEQIKDKINEVVL